MRRRILITLFIFIITIFVGLHANTVFAASANDPTVTYTPTGNTIPGLNGQQEKTYTDNNGHTGYFIQTSSAAFGGDGGSGNDVTGFQIIDPTTGKASKAAGSLVMVPGGLDAQGNPIGDVIVTKNSDGTTKTTSAVIPPSTSNNSSSDSACGLLTWYTPACWLEVAYQLIYWAGQAQLSIAAWVLWAAGVMFNLSIVTFVIHMKDVVEKISVVYVIWQTVRDLANMFFIFIMLFIAIQTILQTGNYKKMLADVVIVALFINFSFFFTGFLIDASNIVALQFYNGFAGTTCNTIGGTADGCMSQKVVDALRLGSIYTDQAPNNTNGTLNQNNKTTAKWGSLYNVGPFLTTVIFGSILMIITAGIFLASAIMIFVRFVTLVFVLMFSPLALAASILPGTKKYFSKWSNALTSQLIFAPVYFMFLWVTMKIIESNALGSTGSFGNGFSGNPTGLFGLIANYIIIIMLLLYSITLAKDLGAGGVGLAEKASKGFQGFIGQQTVGRLAQKIDKKWMGGSGVLSGNGRIGGALRSITTEKVANSGFGGKGSFVDYQKTDKARIKNQSEQGRKNTIDATIKRGVSALKTPPDATATQAIKDEHQSTVQNLANIAKTLGTKDLTSMKSKDVEALARAGMITSSQVSAVLDDKNDSHNSVEKDSIRAAYSEKVNKAITTHLNPPTAPVAPPTGAPAAAFTDYNTKLAEHKAQIEANEKAARDAVAALGEDGVKIVDPKLTTGKSPESETFIQMASGKQYEKIIENTYDEGKEVVRKARLLPITEIFDTPAHVIAADPIKKEKALGYFAKLDAKDTTKLNDGVLTLILRETSALESMTIQRIKKLAEELKNNDPKAAIIRFSIENYVNTPGTTPNPKIKKVFDYITGDGKDLL